MGTWTEPRLAEHSVAVAEREVAIRIDGVALPGSLVLPERVAGIVAFAHGSGSGRSSPRNRLVASILHGAGLGTLLFDLLTVEESLERSNVFDIPLLAGRLAGATGWLAHQPGRRGFLWGTSAPAPALRQRCGPPPTNTEVKAIVSRGGRPDLALPRLEAVRAPTLLIVGGADDVVLDLNRLALEHLPDGSELRVIPGATHLFESRGRWHTSPSLPGTGSPAISGDPGRRGTGRAATARCTVCACRPPPRSVASPPRGTSPRSAREARCRPSSRPTTTASTC